MRTRLPRAEREQQTLDQARALFAAHGYAAVTMDQVAAAVGVTKPLLYNYFGNKEQLFHKALDLYEREKLEYMRTAVDAPTARGVAEKLLWGALEIQMSSCDPRGCLGVISTTACGAEAESIKAEVVKRRASSEQALIERFERAKAEGDLPDGLEPEALVRYLFALMQGMSVQAGSGATFEQMKQLVTTSLSVWPTR